jgi:hypothetical protein
LSYILSKIIKYKEVNDGKNTKLLLTLTPKALWWPKNGLCYFGQVHVIRRCDMILWKFYGNLGNLGILLKVGN